LLDPLVQDAGCGGRVELLPVAHGHGGSVAPAFGEATPGAGRRNKIVAPERETVR
jgi:hypothetical protein